MLKKLDKGARVISSARLLILCGILLAGCHTAEKVAVTTFRVMDTPARYIRDRIDPPEAAPSQNQVSDVATPGRPMNGAQPSPSPHRSATQGRSTSPVATNRPPQPEGTSPRRPAPSATPRTPATQSAQFPTARPVPGKPGYVYSVDPKGGIVDVTGYKTGDKAKDPYTQQIFIVP